MIEVGQAGGAVVADTKAGFTVGSARGFRRNRWRGMVRVKTTRVYELSTMAGKSWRTAGRRRCRISAGGGRGDITVLIRPIWVCVGQNSNGGAPRIVSIFPEIRAGSG